MSDPDGLLALRPLGHVRGGRAEPTDDGWGEVRAVIELDPERLDADSTRGLAAFSHVEVVFAFHLVNPSAVSTGARRPRGRADLPEVGILAQRAKDRPNRIGVSRCRLLEVDGLRLHVQGLDAVDGTPVLDVKPWMDAFGPLGERTEPEWVASLMARYHDADG